MCIHSWNILFKDEIDFSFFKCVKKYFLNTSFRYGHDKRSWTCDKLLQFKKKITYFDSRPTLHN